VVSIISIKLLYHNISYNKICIPKHKHCILQNKHTKTNTIHDYNNDFVLPTHNLYRNSTNSSIFHELKTKNYIIETKQKLHVPCMSFHSLFPTFIPCTMSQLQCFPKPHGIKVIQNFPS
jgi:hypothetical protein